MVLDRRSERFTHRLFHEIVDEFHSGDVLVVNDTRVIRARLIGQKKSGGKAEILLTEKRESLSPREEIWDCLVKSSKRLRHGTIIEFDPDLVGEILTAPGKGWRIRLSFRGLFGEVIERVGRVPLPPYIKREPDNEFEEDRERYQTVFAREDGAIAAPTAGLHFTRSLLSEIRKAGVSILFLTLHIGIGTFLPVRAKRIEAHHMQEEAFEIPLETANTINSVRESGGSIVAVGTSTTRALESAVDATGRVVSGQGATGLYIYPPFRFRVVDALVTNFHLPESTLVMLVSAFATRDLIFRAYREAIEKEYRFYSYGDAMMIK
jgi:S-adenosylmethionine:tRNA ribosyltransferase-isomerase